MNWKRGLFRVWLVAAGVWIMIGGWMLAGDLTATRQRVPPGLNEYDCLLNRAACSAAVEPDWNTRKRALAQLMAPLVVAPAFCFVVFWAGLGSFRTAAGVARGFRQGREM